LRKEDIIAKQNELLAIENIDERISYVCKEFSEGRLPAKIFRWLYKISDEKYKLILVNNIYSKDNENRSSNMQRCSPKQLLEDEILEAHYDKESYTHEVSLFTALQKYQLIDEFIINKDENSKYKFQKLINDPASFFRILLYRNKFPNFLFDTTYKKAMKEFFEEISGDNSELGIWKNTTIGVEVEFLGLQKSETTAFASKALINFPDIFADVFDRGYSIKGDSSLHDKRGGKNVGGTEIVSPIIRDSEEDWKRLSTLCTFIKLLGGKTNQTCGGHIHIGVNILDNDSVAWETFFRIWSDIEPIMYMITNRKGEKTRVKANEYASPNGDEMNRILTRGTINIKNRVDIAMLAEKFGTRYLAVNFMNLYYGQKETIEFRLANGTIDYDVIRENIALFVGILQFAKTHSFLPKYKQSEYEVFFEVDISEEEKLKRFLNLIFDDENTKEVYIKRWMYIAGAKENVTFSDRRYQKCMGSPLKKKKKLIEQVAEIAVTELGDEKIDETMEVIINANDKERQTVEKT
jgi:hypothetical protein